MSQRKLRLEELKVDSFEVLPETQKERGTVQGNAAITVTQGLYTCFDFTCRYNYTCAFSCGGTCNQFTCGNSCQGTCGITCYLTDCDQYCPQTRDLDICPIQA